MKFDRQPAHIAGGCQTRTGAYQLGLMVTSGDEPDANPEQD